MTLGGMSDLAIPDESEYVEWLILQTEVEDPLSSDSE